MYYLKVCIQCNKQYVTKRNAAMFCSNNCMTSSLKKKPNVKCEYCGKDMHMKPYRLKRAKYIYCSKKCFSEDKKVKSKGSSNHQYGLKGELNGSYKNGIRVHLGYIHFINYITGKSERIHRSIYEEHLRTSNINSEMLCDVEGFKRLKDEVHVHHKNEIKHDNRIENLQGMSMSEHTKLHSKARKLERKKDGTFMQGINFKSGRTQLTKKHIQDAGFDIHSDEDVTIPAKGSVLVSTDLYLEIPENHVGLLWSRSGLSVKHKIETGAGCIDCGYTGEIKVHLYNHSEVDYNVKKGDKITQLLIIPINIATVNSTDDFSESERGTGGFGSTGL